MGRDRFSRRHALSSAFIVAVLYLVVSLGWILFSDAAVLAIADNATEIGQLQNIKGIGFVTVMSVLLGVIIYRLVAFRTDRERVSALMSRDPVTRLLNLYAFSEQLRQAVARNRPFSVIVVDVAGFAGINASLGRDRGDQVLSTLGGRLRRGLGDECTVARLQADTFGVIAPPADANPSGVELADGLVGGLGSDLNVDGKFVELKITAGVAEFPDDGDSVAQLMDAADIALRRTRMPGARRAARYESAWQKARTEHFLLETELRDALRRRQLEVHFQPQFDLATSRLSGAEALLRWMHPEQGEISPQRFIPVAEQTGLIDQLTEFVLDAVCRQMRGWIDEGLEPVPVGVNIAGHQLGDLQLGVYVRDAVERHGVPFRLLQIEITERLAVRDPERGIELLNALRTLGVTIALDDFGTGYSSLQYLLELPVDVLKIDRGFIADLAHNPQRARFVKAIIELGRDLGMIVVAEGVETAEQHALLHALGCDFAQGYLLGRPVPAAAFRAQLRDVY